MKESAYRSEAKNKLKVLFDANRQEVYNVRQLQVMLEKWIFHWVTHQAIIELEAEGYLKRIIKQVKLPNIMTELHFYTHYSNRYPHRQANILIKLLQEYSQEHIARGCGNRAELLFAAALAGRGFTHIGPSINEYEGRKWTKTGHNLAYIFEKNDFACGCEIKNQLPYIEKEELTIKIEICKYLQVRPLLIMRYAPKVFINEIQQAGGYAMIFEAHIYELGQKVLVEKMKKAFGETKADCPRAIPSGIIDRFVRWHENPVNLKIDSHDV